MRGNSHVSFLGGWTGVIPSGYPAPGRFGGRPKALPAEKRQWAVQLYQEKKIAVKHICELMGISKPTLYAYVRQTQSSS